MASTTNLPLFIGGKACKAISRKKFENINPASGKKICDVEQAGRRDIEKAVVAARKGFAVWSAMSGTERGRILIKAAQILRERRKELAEIEVRDTGKPISEALVVDIDSGADALEFFGGLAADIKGDHHDLGESAFAYTRREPLGICAGIGAWNYPMQIACWKTAPALACGNSMIFKPSEMTPTNAFMLAGILKQAGLPDGVYNVVHGMGETGHFLASHPDIDKISFTGSVPTGKLVLKDAAETVKYVTMELGGKSPLIIFDDSQLDNAVSAAMNANFYTQGEVCSNGTRVYVHEDIHDDFIEALKERTEAMVIGDPMSAKTHIGSLINKSHLEKVLEYVRLGIEEGAYLVSGGEEVAVKKLSGGSFMSPAIFTACQDDMRICREEIFGPVMSVMSFREEEEVINRANDTELGLSAGVFTQNLARAHRVVAKLRAGTCWINNYNLTPIGVPFGGYKQSGIGRENAAGAIEHFTQVKSVYVELGDVECDY
ncbi:betaine-aldehyde dehydrogenase [Sneathiella marina]|uniref:Betaine-aldehyde dehydrogenase n=1 Tax=Sneathiella marina TaxID=2950108 RepID=A0ABY4WBD8_9PROT|nr:betaine-aldehyde dehydrogenase [Sneathiella marina]USG63085.1 betaine-aldehyde dehydrogenase [Sneathiella marina]